VYHLMQSGVEVTSSTGHHKTVGVTGYGLRRLMATIDGGAITAGTTTIHTPAI